MINLAILKLFIADRNSFTVEERKKLGLNQNANLSLNEIDYEDYQVISLHNEKVKTNSLNMITGNTPGNLTENEQATMSTPINTPSFQNIP